jgi:hypothetical protein
VVSCKMFLMPLKSSLEIPTLIVQANFIPSTL